MELYRLSEADFDTILAFQNGVCPISGLPAGKTRLNVDHQHAGAQAGLIRGLLNWKINKGLAFFNDDPRLLRLAAEYLENPPATAALGAPRYGLIGRAKQGKKKATYGPPGSAQTHS